MKNTWSLQVAARAEVSFTAEKAATIDARTTVGLLEASMALWRPWAL